MAHYSAEILKTLAEQIRNLTPLRESYSQLKHYYRKLSRDFDDLLVYGDRSQNEIYAQLKYLEAVHHELEQQFSYCGEELRQMQCAQAKLLMENNQQQTQSSALESRQQLETAHHKALEEKHRDWTEQNSKLQFSISKYKELIHSIQLSVKTKQFENADIEREIKKMELVNERITQLNTQSQSRIGEIQQDNEQTVEEIQQLEGKLDTYDRLIETKSKLNKENTEILIMKTEELQQLRHRRDYITKLIENEHNEQKGLTQTSNQLQSILAVKRQKLNLLQQENREYEQQIQGEKDKRGQNKEQFSKLTNYLQTLIHTNETLFRELERSCSQDREVQLMLSQKLEKLIWTNDKMTENQILNRFDTNLSQPKDTQNTTCKAMKEVNPRTKGMLGGYAGREKLNPIEQRVLARGEKINSSWSSFTKENSSHNY